MTPLQEQITALGGVFQAAALVDKLAHSGQVSDVALAYMLKTLLVRNPETTLDVYGGDDLGLRDGYKLLWQYWSAKPIIYRAKACAMWFLC